MPTLPCLIAGRSRHRCCTGCCRATMPSDTRCSCSRRNSRPGCTRRRARSGIRASRSARSCWRSQTRCSPCHGTRSSRRPRSTRAWSKSGPATPFLRTDRCRCACMSPFAGQFADSTLTAAHAHRSCTPCFASVFRGPTALCAPFSGRRPTCTPTAARPTPPSGTRATAGGSRGSGLPQTAPAGS